MSKNILGMLAVVLAFGVMLAGCKSDDNSEKTNEPVTPQETTDMPALKLDFESLADWYLAAVKKCHPQMQKVWDSSANPADFNLLLVKETKDKVYLITPEGKQEVKQSEWTDGFRTAIENLDAFHHIRLGDKRCTMILCSIQRFEKMDQALVMMGHKPMSDLEKVGENLALFYHEAFHQYVQDGDSRWTSDKTAYNRDNSYPIVYEPRIYRKLALFALKKAWEDPSQKAAQYARAKYWTQKYESAYAEEAQGIKSTDITESTAEYFGRALVHSVVPQYPQLHDIDTINLSSDLDGESYMMAIVINLLFRDGRQAEAISTITSGKVTPINILLKDVAAPANYDESQDAADMATIRAAMDKTFGPESPFLQPVAQLTAQHRGGENVYLVVKFNDGYIGNDGSFTLSEFKGLSCDINMQTVGDGYELSGITILEWRSYLSIPIQTADILTLTNEKPVTAYPSKVYEITCDLTATLTAVSGVEGLTVTALPAKVERGKDKLGNIYFVLTDSTGQDDPELAPSLATLQEWQAGSTVTEEAVEAFGGVDRCFAAEPIPDNVWARMQDKTYKENPHIGRDDLRHIRALHWDYDSQIHVGEMICNQLIADRVANILRQLYDAQYPIQLMVLPDEFDADDEMQMRANNSSCFCYRAIAGTTKLSKHARGLAVDINTLYNPYYKDREDGTRYVQPATAVEYCDRTLTFPYKIDHDDLCFKLFTEAGFEWGGDWTSCKDFQHFELIE